MPSNRNYNQFLHRFLVVLRSFFGRSSFFIRPLTFMPINKQGPLRPFLIDGAILTRQLESGSVQTHVIRIRLRTRRASSYPDNSSFTGFYLSFTGLFVPSFMMELPSANRHSTAAPS
ncbi:hypothetical protein D0Y65_034492 [Glycine soja]|nr:hypothetical protein D0Y65_034492 [Glycine soja]